MQNVRKTDVLASVDVHWMPSAEQVRASAHAECDAGDSTCAEEMSCRLGCTGSAMRLWMGLVHILSR